VRDVLFKKSTPGGDNTQQQKLPETQCSVENMKLERCQIFTASCSGNESGSE